MPPTELTGALRDEYNHLFALAAIRPAHRFEIDAVIERILDPRNLARYRRVETSIGVPAHVVGIIHNLESSLRFDRHLHNGDPLTGRTVHVPAGRPIAGSPPFEWFESAIDAFTMHSLDTWTDWSVSGMAFVFERYNGFGYRSHHPHVKSPYLWSFTTIYSSGRYVADGQFSDTAVSRQCGAMAVLKRMIELGKIAATVAAPPPDSIDVETAPKVPAPEGASAPLSAPPPYPGHLLRINSTGPDVTTLQLQLRAIGIDPRGIDGDFGENTASAVRRFQARTADETGTPLEMDGIVGRTTWAALFGGPVSVAPTTTPPSAGSLADRVLRIAAGEIGVHEEPMGSNRGPRVDQYLNAVGPDLLGAPWCMAFVYFCFGQAASAAGVANSAPRTAGVKRSWQLAHSVTGATIVPASQAAGEPSLVVPGMVFYIDTGPGTGHAGFVADVIGNTLITIEGNSNANGSREGIGVFHLTRRRIRDINMGFVAFP